ncbi:MAG: hypothetical protein V4603_03705 [Pseudomonadota bacterium]
MTPVTHAVIAEMQLLETALLHTDFSLQPQQLELLLADTFAEVSPNGQTSSRAQVSQWLLHKDASQRWQLSQWHVTELAATVRLVRYHAAQTIPPSQSKGSWHCSIWVYDAALQSWRLQFHQSSKVS